MTVWLMHGKGQKEKEEEQISSTKLISYISCGLQINFLLYENKSSW